MKTFVCITHHKSQRLICAAENCHYIMCQDCLLTHRIQSGHCLVVKFNKSALNFFTSFVGYVHYKLYEIIDIVRRQDVQAIFNIISKQQKGLYLQLQKSSIKTISIKVLQFYQQLMKTNRQFVFLNIQNENLLHPQFLKDLYNMSIYSWEKNSKIIENNFNQKLKDEYGNDRIKVSIKKQIIEMIEKQRKKHLENMQQNIILNIDKNIEKQQISYRQQSSLNGDQYQVPWSVVQVESQQQFANIQSSNLIKDQKTIDLPLKQQKNLNIPALLLQLAKLKIQNKKLKQQNQKLRNMCFMNTDMFEPTSTSIQKIKLKKRKSFTRQQGEIKENINPMKSFVVKNSIYF